MFENFNLYGDPAGSLTVRALELAVPTWILADDMQPMVITWGFIGSLAVLLYICVW